MLFEASTVLLCTCVIALLCVVGNKLGLWQSWFMCAAGTFTFVIALSLATPLDGFVSGLLLGALAALLYWIGRDNVAQRPGP